MRSMIPRKQCDVAIVTNPPSVLESLDLKIGNDLRIDVRNGALVMVPATHSKHKRYTLVQLLEGATPKAIKALGDYSALSQEGDAVGSELV
jgi:antitoxin component of MazEF toxin-antitoxin module